MDVVVAVVVGIRTRQEPSRAASQHQGWYDFLHIALITLADRRRRSGLGGFSCFYTIQLNVRLTKRVPLPPRTCGSTSFESFPNIPALVPAIYNSTSVCMACSNKMTPMS